MKNKRLASRPKEWREKYPNRMQWEDVPEERRVTAEDAFLSGVITWAAEGSELDKHKCNMAIDFGQRWGKRYGVYAKCSKGVRKGEKYCFLHGGANPKQALALDMREVDKFNRQIAQLAEKKKVYPEMHEQIDVAISALQDMVLFLKNKHCKE